MALLLLLAQDASGQTVVTIANIQVSEITATSATITWETNVPLYASVERNVEPTFFLCPPISEGPQDPPHYCTVWDTIQTTTPAIRLTALAPETTYQSITAGIEGNAT